MIKKDFWFYSERFVFNLRFADLLYLVFVFPSLSMSKSAAVLCGWEWIYITIKKVSSSFLNFYANFVFFLKKYFKLAPGRVEQSKTDSVQHLYTVCCKVTIYHVAIATATNRIFSSCSTLLRANFIISIIIQNFN